MEANLMSVGSTVLGVVLAIVILLAMITIHEFGHYVAGRLLKFKINEFSIGFGPALFKRRSKKTGELFAVRLIPLGGYCAFEGEDGLDEEEAEKSKKSKNEPPMPEGEASETPFLSVELTQPAEGSAPATSGEGAPASAEQAAPAVAAADLGEEKKEPADGQDAPQLSEGAFTKKKPWQRIIVLVAGAFMNYLLALVLILILLGAYGQSLVMVRGADLSGDYAAYSFEEGDVLLAAEGKNLYLTTDIAQAINGKKAGELVRFRVAHKTETGYTEETREVMLRCDVQVKNSNDVGIIWKALGIGIEELPDASSETGTSRYYMLSTVSYRFGFFETIGRSFVYSYKIAGSIFKVLGELLTGKLGIRALGGPVTTITVTSKVAASGFNNFLEIAAYIGVNLAVFNLLPIPALDGSKIVFTAIEWVRGKPISRKIEAIIHAAGFLLLLGFAILVDILQFV